MSEVSTIATEAAGQICDKIPNYSLPRLTKVELLSAIIQSAIDRALAAQAALAARLSDKLKYWNALADICEFSDNEGWVAVRKTLTAQAEQKERCEHCGSDRIYHGPPDCPGCGAPNCCQTCCTTTRLEQQLKAKDAEVVRLRQELAVSNQIGDTFWAALKLLNLQAIDVNNPGRHFTAAITDLRTQLAQANELNAKAHLSVMAWGRMVKPCAVCHTMVHNDYLRDNTCVDCWKDAFEQVNAEMAWARKVIERHGLGESFCSECRDWLERTTAGTSLLRDLEKAKHLNNRCDLLIREQGRDLEQLRAVSEGLADALNSFLGDGQIEQEIAGAREALRRYAEHKEQKL